MNERGHPGPFGQLFAAEVTAGGGQGTILELDGVVGGAGFRRITQVHQLRLGTKHPQIAARVDNAA